MPSLLLVTYYFPPWGMGGVQRALKFAKYLPEFGWEVTVITPEVGEYHQQDSSLLNELPHSAHIERVPYIDRALATARKIPATTSLGRSLSRWFDFPDRHRRFARLAIARARELMRARPFDCVLTTSPPPSVHLVGLELSASIPWIADFRDPWQALPDDHGPTVAHRLYNIRLHKRILQESDSTVTVTPELASHLAQLHESTCVTTIRNGYDESDFTSVLLEGERPRLPRGTRGEPALGSSRDGADTFTILCPGTFSRFSDPRPIFRAVGAWRTTHSDRVRVIHIGASMGMDAMRCAKAAHIDDIYSDLGYVDHQRAITELCRADLLAISYTDMRVSPLSVPGRVYEALRAQRPILAFTPTDGALARLLRNIPACYAVSPDDHQAGVNALDELINSPQVAPARFLNSIRQFERREQTRQLSELMLSAISKRQGSGR